MRCPTLSELPPTSPGKTGWPWTEESPQLPDTMSGGSSWPRVSIVTLSYNQGQFIEETIRSVLLQGYPNLEYIIMDGGSIDGSRDIIQRYEGQLEYWTSEPDAGQADAIAKGFQYASGEILCWLNSDDLYLPNTLHTVANTFMSHKEADVGYGNTYRVDSRGSILAEQRQTPFLRAGYLYGGMDLQQPSVFWTRRIYEHVGGVDTSLQFAMDTDLFYRFAIAGARFVFVREFLSCFREHASSKTATMSHISNNELATLNAQYLSLPYESARATLIRSMVRLQRAVYYSVQGDIRWLLGRVLWRLGLP